MALAFLQEGDSGPEGLELLADLGTSSFYDYRIGSGPATADGRLSEVEYTSKLVRRPSGEFANNVRFRVPAALLRGERQIQLSTYRDERRNGPTWSRILSVRVGALRDTDDPWSDMMSGQNLRKARTVAPSFREVGGKAPCHCGGATTPRAAPCRCKGGVVDRGRGTSIAASAAPRAAGLVFESSSPVPLYSATEGFTLRTRFLGTDAATRSGAVFPRAILEVRIHAAGPALATTSTRIEGLKTGDIATAQFDAASLAAVPRGRALRVEATLRCKGANGQVATFATVQTARVVDVLFLDIVGPSNGREILLDDPERDRAFWHRFWKWSCPPESEAVRWQHDVLARYYVRQTLLETNGRIATRAMLEPSSNEVLTYEQTGRLRSGLELALQTLNALLPARGAAPALSRDELSALADADLEPMLSLQATVRLRAQGKRATEFVAWAVPSVELRPLTYRRVETVDGNGHVLTTSVIEREFPFPSSIRFYLLRSDPGSRRPGPEGPSFEGYETLAALRVPLQPIALVDLTSREMPA